MIFETLKEKEAYNEGLQIAIDNLEAEVSRLRKIGRAWTKSRISEHLSRVQKLKSRLVPYVD